jgi:hypothetical protein
LEKDPDRITKFLSKTKMQLAQKDQSFRKLKVQPKQPYLHKRRNLRANLAFYPWQTTIAAATRKINDVPPTYL